jgi:hemolysin III
VAYTIFASSMTLLYSASAVHHLIPKSLRYAKLFRKLDHSMIFILIAGTYTPVCLIALKSGVGSLLLVLIWLIAFAGIAIKVAGIKLSRHASTALYIGMGWVAVSAIVPIVRELSFRGFSWLLAGGIAYSIGALIYAYRIPDPVPKLFGFHEIFHLFVMAGSACHFWTIFAYVF